MHYAFSYLWWIWRWNRCLIRYLCITSPINILCNWIHGLCTTLNIIRSWFNVGTWFWNQQWQVVIILIFLWKDKIRLMPNQIIKIFDTAYLLWLKNLDYVTFASFQYHVVVVSCLSLKYIEVVGRYK